MAEHADGTWNDALLRVIAFACVWVLVSNDFDAIDRRSHRAFLNVAQKLRRRPPGEIPRTLRKRFVRKVMMLRRVIIPHRSMGWHELNPSCVVNLGFRRILRPVPPEQNTQVIAVYGIHARGEDQTKAAIIRCRIRES